MVWWVATAYHGVRVRDEVFKGVQEALVLYQLGIDVMQLGDTHSCCFAHVRVLILEALPEWLTQVLCDLVNADAAHGPHSQGPDQGIGILTILRGTSHWPGAGAGSAISDGPPNVADSTQSAMYRHLAFAR